MNDTQSSFDRRALQNVSDIQKKTCDAEVTNFRKLDFTKLQAAASRIDRAMDSANVSTENAIDALSLEVDQDDFVDPWNVESKSDAGVDYDKLISEWIIAWQSVII